MDELIFDDAVKYATGLTDRTVWVFASTDGAYNTSQVNDAIRSGDILLVPSETVAGFIDGAWPIAATAEIGNFHKFDDTAPEVVKESAAVAVKVWEEYRSRVNC